MIVVKKKRFTLKPSYACNQKHVTTENSDIMYQHTYKFLLSFSMLYFLFCFYCGAKRYHFFSLGCYPQMCTFCTFSM